MKFSSWNIICFGQKDPIKVQCFRLLSALMKVHPMPHDVFETTRSVFVQILHHCSVSWNISLLYFCSSNLVYFGRKELIKKKFLEFWVLGGKLFKLFISYLKPQVSFSSNFASLFIVTRCNSSVLFYLKLYMIWTNEPNKVQNFSLLIAQVKFHQIYTLIGTFCWKYTKFQLRKCRGFMSHDTEDWCKIRRKTELLFPKVTQIWWILTRAFEILKIFTLVGPEELSFMALKSDGIFEEKLTCGLENDMRNIFTKALEKS